MHKQLAKQPVTVVLVIVLILWYGLQETVFPAFGIDTFVLAVSVDEPLEVLSYFTALLSHWNLPHLVTNVLGILVAGSVIERKRNGRSVVLLFLVAGLVSLAFYPPLCSRVGHCGYIAGASAGSYGLYGFAGITLVSGKNSRYKTIVGVTLFVVIVKEIVSPELLPAAIHLVSVLFTGYTKLCGRASSNIKSTSERFLQRQISESAGQ